MLIKQSRQNGISRCSRESLNWLHLEVQFIGENDLRTILLIRICFPNLALLASLNLKKRCHVNLNLGLSKDSWTPRRISLIQYFGKELTAPLPYYKDRAQVMPAYLGIYVSSDHVSTSLSLVTYVVYSTRCETYPSISTI